VLPQKTGFWGRAASLYWTAAVIKSVILGGARRERRGRMLVGSEDKARPLRDDLWEGRGSLPAASEGANAVHAADVGHCSETVVDRGPAALLTGKQSSISGGVVVKESILVDGDTGAEAPRWRWRWSTFVFVPCCWVRMPGV
jgi:hypothetical protein